MQNNYFSSASFNLFEKPQMWIVTVAAGFTSDAEYFQLCYKKKFINTKKGKQLNSLIVL